MNPETLKALRGSIRKWRAIVAGTGDDLGVHNCPLCQRFFGPRSLFPCELQATGEKCPVYERTGKCGCEGSPYDQWDEADIDTPESEAAAKAELDFLISLLPKGKKP